MITIHSKAMFSPYYIDSRPRRPYRFCHHRIPSAGAPARQSRPAKNWRDSQSVGLQFQSLGLLLRVPVLPARAAGHRAVVRADRGRLPPHAFRRGPSGDHALDRQEAGIRPGEPPIIHGSFHHLDCGLTSPGIGTDQKGNGGDRENSGPSGNRRLECVLLHYFRAVLNCLPAFVPAGMSRTKGRRWEIRSRRPFRTSWSIP